MDPPILAATRTRVRHRPLPDRGYMMHFYELHEGDNDVFADLLLVREEEMDPEEFFEVVQSVRRRIQDTYDSGTLVEAIAAEL